MDQKQGKLAHIGMPKLLHLIYRKGDGAAILDIVREPVKKRFFFKNGLPVAATSNILNEVLGRLLMQEGIISQQDYETSLQTVLKEKRKHGEVLISMGLITAPQLETFLALQLKRRLWKIFGWNEGAFRYIKADSVPEGVTKAPPHPASLILDGINLGFYPSQRIKADLKPRMDEPMTPVEAPPGYTLEDFGLNLQEKRFLSAFDGKKTLKDALKGSDLLRHRALSIALSFIITGFLKGAAEEADELEFFEREHEPKPAEAPGEQRVNAELLFMKAKSALESGEYRSALDTLKEITDLNPVEGEYWAYLGWAVYKENPDNIEEANRILRDAIDLNNDLDSAWYFLGMISLAMGDARMAEKSFRTSVAKNPWMLDAVSELKRIEIMKSLPARAEDRTAHLEPLGYEEDPFTDEPEPRYFLVSEGQQKAVDFIAKVIRKKAGPALVTGAEGSGKTTVVLELLKRLSNGKVLSAAILDPPERELDLMKEINREVDSPTEAATIKEQLLNLGMRVSQNKIQGGQTIVIIDQAHRLSSGCLKLVQYLSRLKTVQIILLGEPPIIERLKDPGLKELDTRLAPRLSIAPFNAVETEAYITKRLNEARKNEFSGFLNKALSAGDLRAVFEQSNGLPGEINRAGPHILKRLAEQDAESVQAALGEESKDFETLAPPRIFPENEMDVDKARRELEIESAPAEAALAVEAEGGHGTEDSKETPKTPGHAPKAPEGKRGVLAKAIFWIIIVVAAAVLAGVLSGVIETGGLFKDAPEVLPVKAVTESPAPAPAKTVETPVDTPEEKPEIELEAPASGNGSPEEVSPGVSATPAAPTAAH
ncbi:MAG: AAA family ATPase [Deltaproteobacteria bacterium]|nr:AAA family ATPase [Deltaproteobacteria bacterium]